MDRLTQRVDQARYVLAKPAKFNICNTCDAAKTNWPSCCQKCSLHIAIQLLAAYEDTGLTPEEIYILQDMDHRAKAAEMLRKEDLQAENALFRAELERMRTCAVSLGESCDSLRAELEESTRTQRENYAKFVRQKERADQLEGELERLQAAQRWISVGEKMPENELVLTYTPGRDYEIAEYHESLGWWSDRAGSIKKVTHWRPLPEDPEEVKRDWKQMLQEDGGENP